MRDPNRIDAFLTTLGAFWHLHPDYRFGQLIMNLTRDAKGGFEDPWHWEEDEWLYRIQEYHDDSQLSDEELMDRFIHLGFDEGTARTVVSAYRKIK